ncbi:hypothetical protein PFISCL1PPCAC_1244, partial [Pristionchus fissidentatus]
RLYHLPFQPERYPIDGTRHNADLYSKWNKGQQIYQPYTGHESNLTGRSTANEPKDGRLLGAVFEIRQLQSSHVKRPKSMGILQSPAWKRLVVIPCHRQQLRGQSWKNDCEGSEEALLEDCSTHCIRMRTTHRDEEQLLLRRCQIARRFSQGHRNLQTGC